MAKRFFAQLGAAALGLVLTTGVALADSQSSSTVVQSSDESVVNVTQSNTSTTSEEQSTQSSESSSSSTPSEPASSQPSSQDTQSNNLQHQEVTPPPIPAEPAMQLQPPPALKSVHPPEIASPLSIHQNDLNELVGNLEPVHNAELIPAQTPGTPVPDSPHHPGSPMGMLDTFAALLDSTVVPGTFLEPAYIMLLSVMFTLMAMLAMQASALVFPVNSYTALLRRSGFIGAARSDVTVANQFATPLEMGFIGPGPL